MTKETKYRCSNCFEEYFDTNPGPGGLCPTCYTSEQLGQGISGLDKAFAEEARSQRLCKEAVGDIEEKRVRVYETMYPFMPPSMWKQIWKEVQAMSEEQLNKELELFSAPKGDDK